MSTWISKTVLALLLLSGCVAPDGVAGLLAGAGQSEPRQSLTVSGVKLAGPAGFCPLPDTRQLLGGAGFMAFAPCDGRAAEVLTATIGAEASAEGIVLTRASMAPYFQSVEGVAALRGEDNRDGIAVHEVREHNTAVVVRLTRETSAGRTDQWRAFMQIGGRLVTLTVRPQQGQALSAAKGKSRIAQFVDSMRGANGL